LVNNPRGEIKTGSLYTPIGLLPSGSKGNEDVPAIVGVPFAKQIAVPNKGFYSPADGTQVQVERRSKRAERELPCPCDLNEYMALRHTDAAAFKATSLNSPDMRRKTP